MFVHWPGQVWKGRVNNELKKVQDSYSSSIAACLLQKKGSENEKNSCWPFGGARGVTHHCVISAGMPRLQTND